MGLRVNRFSHPLRQLHEEMDRLFSGFAGERTWGSTGGSNGRQFPAVNVWESGDNLIAEAEVPGLKSEHLEIEVVGSELTIKGQRPDVGEGEGFHRRERRIGPFTRTLRLPVEINPDGVQATLRDGVLTITLPKSEAVKPRKIQVNKNG